MKCWVWKISVVRPIFRKQRIRWRKCRAEGGIYSCALWHGLLADDDTGLEVEALDGAPGVYSARYAGGEGHDSEANMKKLLAELKGKENRKAQFRTAICLIEGGEKHLFEGIVKGEIIREKKEAPASATTRCSCRKAMPRILRRWGLKKRTGSVTGQEPYRSCVTIWTVNKAEKGCGLFLQMCRNSQLFLNRV